LRLAEAHYLRLGQRTYRIDFWKAEESANCCGVNLADLKWGVGLVAGAAMFLPVLFGTD
jgi:hypothetical protein